MSPKFYVAVVDREPGEENWSVLVPDLPEIASVAESREDWASQAYDAVMSAVEFRLKRGIPLPQPTLIDDVTRDWPMPWRAIPIVVPVDLDQAPTSVRVEVLLEEQLLHQIDRAADQRGLSRSGFLAEGARTLLLQEPADTAA